MYKLLTPTTIWAEFDPKSTATDADLVLDGERKKVFTFTAVNAADGKLTVDVAVHTPDYLTQKAVLVVGEYSRLPKLDIVQDLAKRGYLVCVPDYSGVRKDTLTDFPESLSYGCYEKAGERLTRVSPSAKETAQYLYTVIIRRTLTFMQDTLGRNEIALVGIGEGVEIAMQTVGMDKRPLGLVCINGASYKEYLHLNRYEKNDPPIDDEMMCWLTGVSSIAYAKHISVPVLFAVGSNDSKSDIDRLSNVISLLPEGNARAVIAPCCVNNIDRRAYTTVTVFLEELFYGSILPDLPVLTLNVTKEGDIYAECEADVRLQIKAVKIYYAYGNYDHTTRYWEEKTGEYAGKSQYIAKLALSEQEVPLFAFPEVEYLNGIVLSGTVSHLDLKGQNIRLDEERPTPIVFQYGHGETSLTESVLDGVVLSGAVDVVTLPVGLRGIRSNKGSLITFSIGTKNKIKDDKLLQIDTYIEEEGELRVTLISSDGERKEYTAVVETEPTEVFESHRFVPSDFKDENYFPLESWKKVKGIRINAGVTVGKILFV